MKNKKLLYKDIDHSSLDRIIYTVHLDNDEIFWSSVTMNSLEYEIYSKSDSKDELLILLIEKQANFSKNVTKHSNLKRFLSDKGILDEVRNFKLNKILK